MYLPIDEQKRFMADFYSSGPGFEIWEMLERIRKLDEAAERERIQNPDRSDPASV